MNSFQKQRYLARLITDIFLILLAFIVARTWFPSHDDLISTRNLEVFSFIIVSWYFSAKVSFLYDNFLSRRLSAEFLILFKTLIYYSFIVSIAAFFISKDPLYSKKFVITFLGILWLVLPVEKYLIRWFYGEFVFKKQVVKVLIIGTGELAMRFYKKVIDSDEYGYKLAGFVDDLPNPELNGKYLGDMSKLEEILIQQPDIQDVIIALPVSDTHKINYSASVAEQHYKRVSVIPDYFSFAQSVSVSNIGAFPLVSLRRLPLDDLEMRFFKRAFDVILSIFLFVFVFSWLFPIIIILIKLTTRGSVFFIQERWGLNIKPIRCLKFRTMVDVSTDVDEHGKYKQATRNDPRITKIGRILRKTNLDELPQFLNVLRGEMSVVGPRPHPIPLNMESKDTVSNYMLRYLVKPGITGWAQVNGFRGETKEIHQMQKRIDFDLWYIENWSFWLDIQIIFQTMINMIKGDHNAY
ncbi:MAG: undecaprenyl-phosphate glucose phosphotransferase [Chitinophagaceae bacterium]|nr:undecaprenyl-phosphate glucose phosphotransferase [Chitinophagaceae bacterium]